MFVDMHTTLVFVVCTYIMYVGVNVSVCNLCVH